MATVAGQLTEDQVEQARQQATTIAGSATQTIAGNQFVFFGAFDGTRNDKNNVPRGEQSSNVGQLWDQYETVRASSSTLGGNYYPGPGTSDALWGSAALPPQVTQDAINTGERAYRDFQNQASEWLANNPDGSVTLAITSFSRGIDPAAVFSQLVYERGLIHPATGEVLVPPGQIGVSAGVIYDPVKTGMSGNLAFPPNTENVAVIRADNEYRQPFKAVDYGNQPGLTTYNFFGNHCDVGGGNDNGLGALTLGAGTDRFKNSGMPIGDVPDPRQFESAKPVYVHTEGIDSYNNQKWSTYGAYGEYAGPRLTVSPEAPAQVTTDGDTTTIRFTDFSGKEVTYTKVLNEDGVQNTMTIKDYFNGTTTTSVDNFIGSKNPKINTASEDASPTEGTAASQPSSLTSSPATSAKPSPALDENGMPLPEIGKTSGLSDEQWNALAAGLGERPGTIDWSKATKLAANTHADTTTDADTVAGEESGKATPVNSHDGPVIEAEQAPAPVETHTPTPVAATPDPALAAVGNMQSLILAIEHGNDLAATIAAVGLVNNLGQAAGVGNIIPGEIGATLGTIASALNLADALDRGDVGGIVVSGVTLADTVSQGAASKAIAEALGMSAAVDVIPYLGIINGLANGDAVSTLAAAANLIPGYGQVISIAIVFLGAMFGGDDEPDTPTSYGDASASWNDAGDIKIATTRDEADGGATAQAWMNNLLGGLQQELASRTDASGQPLYGLDPARLPGIGYAFDPDTQAGYLRLSWTEPDGTLQWRQYDTSGRRDGSSEAGTNDLVRDFFLHAADAIVPAWEARTLFQQGADGGRRTAFTGELSADGATTTRTVLTLGSAATSTNARLDIDGDGYLEATQWTASPMLAIDLDGDGRITAADLVDGREGSQARNGLAALDANGDGIVDARDPAFAALRLWRDANGDGIAEAGELGSLADVGVERIDASTLARQTLAGDTRGTAQAMTADGLYQFQEGGETTLLALNQHAFDNDPAHAHGGEANPDAHGEMLVDVGAANESRLQSTGNLGPANLTICPSAYAHRHIACRRARPYNSTLSAKTRDQAGSGQPMTVQRAASAGSVRGGRT